MDESITFILVSVTNETGVTEEQIRVLKPGRPADPRIAFFDHRAPTWDNDAGEVARTLARLHELRGSIGLQSGHDVLEVGCGTGRITGWLVEAARPGRVVAADFSPVMLTQAHARGVRAEFRLMDICGELSIAERFDLVLCFNSFPHFRNQFEALRNIRRLLKSGGQLVILHLTGSAELNTFHSKLPHPVCHDHMPSSDLWPEMLAWCGLRLVSLTDEPGLFLLKAVSTGGEQLDEAVSPSKGCIPLTSPESLE